jgi:hemerythrin-like metal-binding protein
MEWDESLVTGHRVVDDQHRAIIGLINEFADANLGQRESEQVAAVLVRLSDYVSTHFAEEEHLMSRYGYSAELTREHREEHLKLSERTRQLILAHRTGEDATVRDLIALMQQWLSEHIMKVDRRLVDHVKAVRASAEDQDPPS